MAKFLSDVKTLRENARKNLRKGSITDAYGADLRGPRGPESGSRHRADLRASLPATLLRRTRARFRVRRG